MKVSGEVRIAEAELVKDLSGLGVAINIEFIGLSGSRRKLLSREPDAGDPHVRFDRAYNAPADLAIRSVH